METLINYKEFDINKVKLNKDSNKKVTYYFSYDKQNQWQLKCPKSEIKGNLIKHSDYSTIDISYPTNHLCLKIFEEIDKKVCTTDKMLQTVKYSNGSFVIRLRVNDLTRIYDKNNKLIDLHEHSLTNLLEPDQILGLIIKLENVRIGQDICKCNWYIKQIKLNKIPKGVNDCDITDTDSDDYE